MRVFFQIPVPRPVSFTLAIHMGVVGSHYGTGGGERRGAAEID